MKQLKVIFCILQLVWGLNLCLSAQCIYNDCIVSDCGNSGIDAYNAITYLCNNGIINTATDVNPDNYILREDLAKIIFLGLFGTNPDIITPADNFPTPYSDISAQGTSGSYHKYARVLCYLEFDNGVSVFDRNFFYFNPGGTLQRASAVKALLEAWNILPDNTLPTNFSDVNPSFNLYGYIAKAEQLGIIQGSGGEFRPFENCTRAHAFIMLHRMLTTPSISAVKPSGEVLNNISSYFVPGNYTVENLVKTRGAEQGNFNFYTKSSFNIPDRNLGLVFEHFYNSYLTELPNDFFTLNPMSKGWSHSYNAFVLKTPDPVNTSVIRYIITWPDGTIHVFNANTNSFETKGVYDTFTPSGTTLTITKKDQTKFVFTSYEYTNEFYLEKIIDRFNNTLIITYEEGEPINIANWNQTPEYATSYRISEVTAPSGRKLIFSYASGNLLSNVSDPLNRSIEFFYTNGKLTSFKDAKSQTTTYIYGLSVKDDNLLTQIGLPKGNIITNTYFERKLTSTKFNNNAPTTISISNNYSNSSAPNFVSSTVTNQDGTIQKFDFDKYGNTTKIQGTEGLDAGVQYTNVSHPTLPTTISNNSTGINISVTSYDGKGNPLIVSTQGGNISFTETYQYNSYNDIVKYTDPRGYSTTFNYSGQTLQSIVDPLGNTTTFTYNSVGQLTSITNPVGVKNSYEYDSFGNRISLKQDGNGATSSFEYDAISRLLTSTGFIGENTTYSYDNNDNVTTIQNSYSYSTVYGYDANDNLTSITNEKGIPTDLEYYFDSDWLKKVSFQDASKQYTYNENGTLNQYTSPNAVTFTNQYDNMGNVTSDGYTQFEYDSNSLLRKVTYNGQFLEYNYDGLNRIVQVKYSDFQNNVVGYEYDNNGNITKITYPDGKSVVYGYNANNQMITVSDWNNKTIRYNYRPDGQLHNIFYPNKMSCNYIYDYMGRLVKVEWVRKNSTNVIAQYTFSYDKGSRIEEFGRTEPFDTVIINQSIENYSYNSANRLSQAGPYAYTYDANGNTLTKGSTSFTYDIYNRLTSITGNENITFGYDGEGNRRMKTDASGTRLMVADINNLGNPLLETTTDGTPINYYIYGLGLAARVTAEGEISYYVYDHLGSVIALVDDSEEANITHKYKYDTYGGLLIAEETDYNPFRFGGFHGITYETSDITYMHARYYDNTTGRFLSEDPVWSTNLYLYAHNNPVMYNDPDGKFAVAAIAITVGWNVGMQLVDNYANGQPLTKDLAGAAVGGLVEGIIGAASFMGAAPLAAAAGSIARNITNDLVYKNSTSLTEYVTDATMAASFAYLGNKIVGDGHNIGNKTVSKGVNKVTKTFAGNVDLRSSVGRGIKTITQNGFKAVGEKTVTTLYDTQKEQLLKVLRNAQNR